jgi:hypothetical protein
VLDGAGGQYRAPAALARAKSRGTHSTGGWEASGAAWMDTENLDIPGFELRTGQLISKCCADYDIPDFLVVGRVTLGFAGRRYCRNHSTKVTFCQEGNIAFFQDVMQPKYGSTFTAEVKTRKRFDRFIFFCLYTTHIIFLQVSLYFLFAPLQCSSQKTVLSFKKLGRNLPPPLSISKCILRRCENRLKAWERHFKHILYLRNTELIPC